VPKQPAHIAANDAAHFTAILFAKHAALYAALHAAKLAPEYATHCSTVGTAGRDTNQRTEHSAFVPADPAA
jgi:hypothetical protein